MGRPTKNPVDWEKIGKLYRLGQLSVREIARQEDVQPSSITRRAEKEGWTRDLTETIRLKTQAKLISNARATPSATDVAVAVATNVCVLHGHRDDIREGKELVGELMKLMRESIAAPDASDRLPQMTSSMVNISNAMKTFITLERQAFNIGDEPPAASDSLTALLDHIKTTGSRLPIKPQETK